MEGRFAVDTQPADHSYHPIALETLLSEEISPLDLYYQLDETGETVLFRSRSFPPSPSDILSLINMGLEFLWVHEKDFERFDFERIEDPFAELDIDIEATINDPSIPVETKCEVTYNASNTIMRKVFESRDPEKVLSTSSKILDSVIDVIFDDNEASHNFIVQMRLDYELYSHSLNVCLYGMSLAQKVLNISKQDALTRYGPGFLLHDFGKTVIPKEILEKMGEWTDDEISQMNEHPITSLKLIEDHISLPPESVSIILHHHERLDGSGYPYGLSEKDISPAARICAIADEFDILSTNRSNRKRMPSFQALSMMRKEVPQKFDSSYFEEFLMLFLPPK